MPPTENPSDNNVKDPVASSDMRRDPLSSIPDPSQIQPSKSPLDDRDNRSGGGVKVNDTTPAKTHSHRGSNGGPKCSFSRARADRRASLADPDPDPHFDLAHDHSFWERYSVQVLIRIRPLSDVEKVSGRCLRQESGNTLAWTPHPEARFTFDHIACETISQEKLFTVAGLPMVENCMSGYNSCMFAYGQTGSGKTYTMMGDISHVTESGKLSEDCGITPRIFEHLFTRIREEENKRGNEGLKYSCKCSFLEIYNEHITDLLEPSSNNLQLREDLKKGVYVENLTEYTVSTVDDVLRLLLQGAANRKMAATYMNSESSRSHSVFTCIVESRWEKDSMTHLRFGRLNLVDLAGSERQKSSGAEGDRLKEAANINKSLSTLGLVIMSLVDLAQGKQRHVPYRDSRLTFLLQDSLGGNSKTTIIANVSPSLCSANETLSTLKFAQRAKLIQNNAKVNEDASGDVMALQREIQQLKGQLSIFLHHGNSSENLLHPSTSFKEVYLSGFREGVDSSVLSSPPDIHSGMQTGTGMKDEAANIRSDLAEDGTYTCDAGQRTDKALIFQCHDIQTELIHAKSLIEAMESNQICMIEELESLRKENDDLRENLKEQAIGISVHGGVVCENQTSGISLLAKLEKLSKDLSETQSLNRRYLEDHAMELHHNQQTQVVQAEVEMETTETILHLQEEIAQLQSELHGRLHSLEEENESLRNRLEAKEAECCDWERATFELTAFLMDGWRSLKDASSQIENITSLFPRDNRWISERVERAAKLCVDKEESISLLKSSLEDARGTVLEMEQKLDSLRGATIALAGVQQMNMDITHAGQKFATQADSFFTRFEEVQGTMKEADCMLNALLRSNDDVKYWSSVWVQAGTDLRTQRDALVEEIKLLNSSVEEREERNGLLYVTLREISTLIQQDGEELCKVVYSDAILSVKEALNNVACLRSLVEEVSSKVKKHGAVSSLLQHSYLIGHHIHGKQPDMNSDNFMSALEEVEAAHSERMVGAVSIDGEKYQIETVQRTDEVHDENLDLKRELERKNVVLQGLLFDISLLQESASSRKYVKDEVDKLTETLNQVQKELKIKSNQLDNMLIQYAALEGRLSETENALVISNLDLEEVRLTLDGLSEENADLKTILKDLYQKKSEADQQLEEQTHAIQNLENEILRMATSAEENLAASVKDTRNDMAKAMIERDSLLDQIQSLQNKLDIACTLTDEKEAIILEIRQESEASKEYAELKEEEVKILTHSVEELESTINVLEKRVYEMEEEVERHHGVRDSLEVEVQDMRERLLMVENLTEDMDSRSSSGELCSSRSLRKLNEGSTELWKAHTHIRNLEKEKEKLVKQIKQYKEYVSELVMHAEAQTSQYQHKYKNLELMVHEVRTDSSKVRSGAPTLDKSEKASAKPRGSSSPFRCISNLVLQMNLEKDQELSVSQLRIEELEALVASQQKEVSLLNTRLASVESMTHDVIRDLLGVKLDITIYSDLVSENRLQKLVEGAQQQAQQYITMERETEDLRKRIHDLVEERESYAMEAGRREADGLATRVALEQIRERAQMLTAQNEMLKADKSNLLRTVAELDDAMKVLMQSVDLPETHRQQQLHFLTRQNDRGSSSFGRLH